MSKLTLKNGDKVTLAKHSEDGKTSIDTYTIVSIKKSIIFLDKKVLVKDSTLFHYLETIGINPTVKQKQKALRKFPRKQKNYFSRIELLEIERKSTWYTSILRKLGFWKKTKK